MKRKINDLEIKNPAEEDWSKAHVIYKKICANIALNYYNNKNDTKFDLIEDEALESYPFTDSSGSWIHCCFNAKADSSIEQFFAEIQYVDPSGPTVAACKILEGETKVGCGNCKSGTHPVDGYKAGLVAYSTQVSLAMSADDKDPLMDHDLEKELVEEDKQSLEETPLDAATTTTTTTTNVQEVFWSTRSQDYNQCVRYANRALAYYNEQNDTKFELVVDETMDSKLVFDIPGNYIHCCFKAKEDSSINKFFPELKYIDDLSPLAITTCKIFQVDFRCYTPSPNYVKCDPCYEPTSLHYHFSSRRYEPASPHRSPSSQSPIYQKTESEREESRESHRKLCMESANLSLAYYNEQNDTKFKLVEDYETMDFRCHLKNSEGWFNGCWFNAREEDSSINAFVAEIKEAFRLPPTVTSCKILREGETKVGCLYYQPLSPPYSATSPYNGMPSLYYRRSPPYCPTSPSYFMSSPGYSPYSPSYEATTAGYQASETELCCSTHKDDEVDGVGLFVTERS